MSDKVTVEIFRFDPSVDAEPRFDKFEVPWLDEGCGVMTGLQALQYIFENEDPTLAYDYCCRAGLCGRCSMKIDGKAGLACFTPLAKGGKHTFEPLDTFPVIKDLVIDRGNTNDLFVQTKIACQTVEPIQKLENIEYDLYWERLERMNMCRECLCCYSVCPKMHEAVRAGEFIGPGAMMQIGLRHLSVNDQMDRVEQAAFSGVFECNLCGECANVCPSHIDLVGTISLLQREAEARGLKPSGLPTANTARSAKPATQPVATGAGPSEIITASCGESSCHDAQKILDFRMDADSAKVRVDTHAAINADLTDDQKQSLVDFFTK